MKDVILSTYWSIVRHIIENKESNKNNKDAILEYNIIHDRNIGILTMAMSLIALYVTSDMNFASDVGKIVLITEFVLDWRKPVRKVERVTLAEF